VTGDAAMSGRSPAVSGAPGPPAAGSRCLFILQRCLAIQLQKVALLSEQRKSARGHDEPEYWMYDSGYLLFQVRPRVEQDVGVVMRGVCTARFNVGHSVFCHTVDLCGFENIQRSFPCTALTDWFL